MNSISCGQCEQTFSSRFNLMRHLRNKHVGGMSYQGVRSPPPGVPEYDDHMGTHRAHLGAHLGAPGALGAHLRAPGAHLGSHLGAPGAPGAPGAQLGVPVKYSAAPDFKFQHPCSVVLTGPSGSGKSVLTKKVLCQGFIKPPPQRIIWCYGQYQPLYDNVKKHLPGVEFVKGIPDFIEHDTYLDTSVRNCIILDDLMGDAKKDERVANLFTKGSHHRNLTVLYITQNLFPQGKSSRDISLNTKYLVLFNNPVDRIQVLNLARRIYPTNKHLFMNTYKRAVEIPYGHLIVDLRANTLEQDRLRANILNGDKSTLPDTNMTNVIRGTPYYEHQCSSEQSSDESDMDMPTCDDCGIVFGDENALQKHVKEWCVGRKGKLENLDNMDEPEPKKWVTLPGDDDSDVEEDDEIMEDNKNEKEVFEALFERAQDENDSKRQIKYDQYLDRNMSEEEAREKADEKMMPIYITDVLERYTLLIQHIYNLRGGFVHQQVIKNVEKFIERDMDEDIAIKAAVRKNRHLIETLLETLTPEDQSEDDGIEEVYTEED